MCGHCKNVAAPVSDMNLTWIRLWHAWIHVVFVFDSFQLQLVAGAAPTRHWGVTDRGRRKSFFLWVLMQRFCPRVRKEEEEKCGDGFLVKKNSTQTQTYNLKSIGSSLGLVLSLNPNPNLCAQVNWFSAF